MGVFRDCLNKNGYNFDDVSKIGHSALVPLKRRLFSNEESDVIIYVHEVTSKILLRDSKHIVDMVMWENSNISLTYYNLNFIRIWAEKLPFLAVDLGLSLIIHQSGKKIKSKSQKCFRTNFYVCRSYRGRISKTEAFLTLLLPSWIGKHSPFSHICSKKVHI